MKSFVGPALVLGDDVNTDELHPSKFYSLDDRKVRSGFLQAVPGRESETGLELAGHIVVAGRNFGCGSSRETGARVFLLAGIQAIVAASFGRIFHRNVLNLGLVALTCPALSDIRPEEGQAVTLDPDERVLSFGGAAYPTEQLDPMWREIVAAGGLVRYLGLDRAQSSK
jgi:3-isopropylmalate/(R)-2-methylmalate dehydratase small subunit